MSGTVADIVGEAAALAPADVIKMPVMGAAELCMLGAMSTSLVDEDVQAWWARKSEADRFRLSLIALGNLVHRELLDPPAPGQEDRPSSDVLLRAKPKLAVLLAARTRPSFIALQRAAERADPGEQTRMYGLADTTAGVRAVLAETRMTPEPGLNCVYMYHLLSAAGCASSLAYSADKDAMRPAAGLLRHRSTQVIDIYRPGNPPHNDVFKVTRDRQMLVVTRGHEGSAKSVHTDKDGLARMVEQALTGNRL